MQFYIYNIIYFSKNSYAHQEFGELLIMDQFHPLVTDIWASILRVGALPHVTLDNCIVALK